MLPCYDVMLQRQNISILYMSTHLVSVVDFLGTHLRRANVSGYSQRGKKNLE